MAGAAFPSNSATQVGMRRARWEGGHLGAVGVNKPTVAGHFRALAQPLLLQVTGMGWPGS